MKRRSISARLRRQIFDASSGMCCLCGGAIVHKAFIIEHIRALAFGGADDASNMAPAHVACAQAKTSAEATRRSKSDRQRNSYIGARQAKLRPMPGSRASIWKRKMDGTIVRREP